MATDAQLVQALLKEAAERRAADPSLGDSDHTVAFNMLAAVFVPALARYAGQKLGIGQKVTHRQDVPGEASVVMTIEAIDPATGLSAK